MFASRVHARSKFAQRIWTLNRFPTRARFIATTSSKQEVKRCFLSGISKFSSRRDLDLLLGGRPVTGVEPYIDSFHYPTGMYALTFENQDDLETLRSQFSEDPGPNRFTLHNNKFEPPKAWLPASSVDISNKTVRCNFAESRIGEDELLFFFDNFELRFDSIRKHIIDGRSHFLVDFSCPEEAERAVMERNREEVMGKVSHLLWYQF